MASRFAHFAKMQIAFTKKLSIVQKLKKSKKKC
jgi:hypothetical protein